MTLAEGQKLYITGALRFYIMAKKEIDHIKIILCCSNVAAAAQQ